MKIKISSLKSFLENSSFILRIGGFAPIIVYLSLIFFSVAIALSEILSIGLIVALLFDQINIDRLINIISLMGFYSADIKYILIAAIVIFRFLFQALVPLLSSLYIAKIAKALSSKILKQSFNLDVREFDKSNSVKQIRLVTGSVNVFCMTFLQAASNFMVELSVTILISIFIFISVPSSFFGEVVLALPVFCAIIFFSLILTNFFSKKKKWLDEQRHKVIVESQHMIREIKTYLTAEWLTEKFNVFNSDSLKLNVGIISLGSITRGSIEFLAIALVLLVYASLEARGDQELESAAGLALLAILRILPSLNRLNATVGLMSFATPFLGELRQYLVTLQLNDQKRAMSNFRYDVGDFTRFIVSEFYFVLYGKKFGPFNLDVIRGDWCQLSGPSGSGKSSAIDIWMGHLDVAVTEGQATVVGSYGERAVWHSNLHFGYVPQMPHIIEGSVYENVLLGRDFSVRDVRQSLELCCFPYLDDAALLFSDARNLSGGEKQRICIARALISNPDLLFIDESFSAIDFETRATIIRNIKEKLPMLTVVYVHHGEL